MSTPPIQYSGPNISPEVPWDIRRHLQLIYQKLGNHTQAMSLLAQQKTSSSSTKTVIEEAGGGGGGSITTQASIPVNNQSGHTSYTTQQGDNLALVLFSDASAISVSLAPQTPPWGCFIVNQGALGSGTVTLTPATGNINGASTLSILPTYWATVDFDGTNWFAATLPVVPVGNAGAAHEWVSSYNASTGAFTLSQPSFADISGVASPSQLPTPTASTLGGVESAGPTAHEWINEIDTSGVPHLSQPAYSDISGAPLPYLTGTTGSLGGSAMTVGQTITATATVTGATTSMAAVCSPATYPGDGFCWDSYVSSSNTVTARLTCVLAGTPTSSVYNVRCIQ